MPQGAYTPKFKVGQTVTSTDYNRFGNTEFIVVFTYLSLQNYSVYYHDRTVPYEYDESDASRVIYCLLERQGEGGGLYTQAHWILESNLELFCNNCERGKKILLEQNNVNTISEWYMVTGEYMEKYIAMLQQPSTDTEYA